MKRVYMDRFIDSIEWVAAGFVGIVAANIFISVVLRNLFTYSIPESYDFGITREISNIAGFHDSPPPRSYRETILVRMAPQQESSATVPRAGTLVGPDPTA